jgi:hypothetical protein
MDPRAEPAGDRSIYIGFLVAELWKLAGHKRLQPSQAASSARSPLHTFRKRSQNAEIRMRPVWTVLYAMTLQAMSSSSRGIYLLAPASRLDQARLQSWGWCNDEACTKLSEQPLVS